jgi:hypothetical protein
VPELKLLLNLCLRCAKDFGPGNEGCDYAPTKKCQRCKRLKKPCSPVPPSAIPGLNSLIRKAARLEEDPEDPRCDAAQFATALRAWVKDVEALLRKEAKHGGTHQPKGDEIALLQVKATERLAVAVEGILDVLRAKVSSSFPGVSPSF